jgi:hypothetical protein
VFARGVAHGASASAPANTRGGALRRPADTAPGRGCPAFAESSRHPSCPVQRRVTPNSVKKCTDFLRRVKKPLFRRVFVEILRPKCPPWIGQWPKVDIVDRPSAKHTCHRQGRRPARIAGPRVSTGPQGRRSCPPRLERSFPTSSQRSPTKRVVAAWDAARVEMCADSPTGALARFMARTLISVGRGCGKNGQVAAKIDIRRLHWKYTRHSNRSFTVRVEARHRRVPDDQGNTRAKGGPPHLSRRTIHDQRS